MKATAMIALVLGVSGCNLLTPVTPVSPLQSQLNDASQIQLTSVQNALNQANTALLPLTGRVNTTGIIDLDAFQRMNDDLLPALINAANALTPESQTQLAEFRRLFTEAMTAMLEGLNGNLSLYQADFETPRGASPKRAQSAMAALAKLFAASEMAERFAAELAPYDKLLVQEDVQTILKALKAQQTTIINGVLTFSRQDPDPDTVRQAYLTIADSLTSANLLSELAALANLAYGAERVALRAETVTPNQANANQLVLVVQEADDQYRLVELQNGQIVDRLMHDTRGLSASDLLYQTQVVEVTPH